MKKFGFEGPFWGSKHPFLVKGSFKLHIPRDHGKDISDPLLREILKQAEIDVKEWKRKIEKT